MALSEATKLGIQAKLRLNTPPKEVAKLFDVKESTVYAISRKLKLDMESEPIDELLSIPTEVIAQVVTEAKKSVVMPTPTTDKTMAAFEAVACGVEGLKKLDTAFQTTMTNVLKRFDDLLLDKETPLKDIIQISNTAANAYEKVFAAGTNIHIGDNNSQSNTQLTIFKSKSGV